MSFEHGHEVVFNDVDDDDGMPPLVDNPLPPMTYTFMTDASFSIHNNEAMAYEPDTEMWAPEMSTLSPPGTPMLGPARPSHAKKRDASYIPRPPNAFILFRSSFIKAQHIPGQIEGNHSALSKIIGKCWRALPREERQVWEAKALVALSEHRKKYPDWRFKHAANTLAKVKDGPRKRGNRKGRGQSEKEERNREKRCAKIADLLVAGTTGTDLAAAIQQYDCEADRGRKPKEEGGVSVVQARGGRRVGSVQDVKAHVVDTMQSVTSGAVDSAAETPDQKISDSRSSADRRFDVPLTWMYKRSSSAPAPRARAPSPDMQQAVAQRRESVCGGPPYFARATSLGNFGDPRPGVSIDIKPPREGLGQLSGDSVFSPQPASVADPLSLPRSEKRGVGDNDAYTLSASVSAYSSPPLPAIESDLDGIDTPALSPVATPIAFGWPHDSDAGSPTSISDMMGEPCALPLSPSSYSSLEGWAGSPLPYRASSPIISAIPKGFNYVDCPGSPGVMAKAFDAASCAAFGDWNGMFGVDDVVGAAHSPYVWPVDMALGYDFAGGYCHQGDF
ncbi:hypothetical protein C8Q79DRAFT_929948 [Trametes meyenii]|nr:hypothetical protein C8Q79DRAFT_929948 [Trametes meyenii]